MSNNIRTPTYFPKRQIDLLFGASEDTFGEIVVIGFQGGNYGNRQ